MTLISKKYISTNVIDSFDHLISELPCDEIVVLGDQAYEKLSNYLPSTASLETQFSPHTLQFSGD